MKRLNLPLFFATIAILILYLFCEGDLKGKSLLPRLRSETPWPHIGPDFFDIGQAFRFETVLTGIFPAERYLLIIRPDRVLLFVI